eukprot:TRINITY_DN1457_c2_g1_i2.p1 TRINITY_DN1457_c2_g1~~TRINITY_DN1457_c2_g1_i2.p1  ORF type:complete len:402 (-),score=71.60 TRINITY_DN1457_c2_g1_i2:57-1172(-)
MASLAHSCQGIANLASPVEVAMQSFSSINFAHASPPSATAHSPLGAEQSVLRRPAFQSSCHREGPARSFIVSESCLRSLRSDFRPGCLLQQSRVALASFGSGLDIGRPSVLSNNGSERGLQITCMAHPRRVEMVAQQIRREVSDMLLNDKVLKEAVLPEARLGYDLALSCVASISDVEISGDLSIAKVYVSVVGDEQGREIALQGLRLKQGYVRSGLGKRMRLRSTPEVRFIYDDSLERGSRVLSILAKLKDERERRERGEEVLHNADMDLPDAENDDEDESREEAAPSAKPALRPRQRRRLEAQALEKSVVTSAAARSRSAGVSYLGQQSKVDFVWSNEEEEEEDEDSAETEEEGARGEYGEDETIIFIK